MILMDISSTINRIIALITLGFITVNNEEITPVSNHLQKELGINSSSIEQVQNQTQTDLKLRNILTNTFLGQPAFRDKLLNYNASMSKIESLFKAIGSKYNLPIKLNIVLEEFPRKIVESIKEERSLDKSTYAKQNTRITLVLDKIIMKALYYSSTNTINHTNEMLRNLAKNIAEDAIEGINNRPLIGGFSHKISRFSEDEVKKHMDSFVFPFEKYVYNTEFPDNFRKVFKSKMYDFLLKKAKKDSRSFYNKDKGIIWDPKGVTEIVISETLDLLKSNYAKKHRNLFWIIGAEDDKVPTFEEKINEALEDGVKDLIFSLAGVENSEISEYFIVKYKNILSKIVFPQESVYADMYVFCFQAKLTSEQINFIINYLLDQKEKIMG